MLYSRSIRRGGSTWAWGPVDWLVRWSRESRPQASLAVPEPRVASQQETPPVPTRAILPGSMRIYIYVVTRDTGFAPNPFHGYCTLATCKPVIRRCAAVGDWVLGVGSIRSGQDGQLLYAMKVEETMSFDDYWTAPRFQRKKPDPSGIEESRCGDNVYHRDPISKKWIQAHSYHSHSNGCQNSDKVRKDTKSSRVLISKHFIYFGKSAVDIPSHILHYDKPERFFVGFPGHRCNFPLTLERRILKWLQDLIQTPGIQDTPTHRNSTNVSSC